MTWAERRESLTAALSRNRWRFEQPVRPAKIAPLVLPLRHDILVRASFFEHLERHDNEFRADFDAFSRRSRRHPYWTWFREIMVPRWIPEALESEQALDAAWRRRLRLAADLHASFLERGYDSRKPVTLYAGRTVEATVTGLRPERALYAGDGNHRIALLLLAGSYELAPDQYRIKRYARLRPLDITSELKTALSASGEGPLRSISPSGPRATVDASQGRAQAVDESPPTEVELRSTLKTYQHCMKDGS
jgi:hypothetical protein